jgi:hypothetical protein
MTIPREFHSVEQALKEVIKDLKNKVKDITGKTESHFRKCSDESDHDHHVYHADSIKLDIECMREGLGSPMLSAHQYQIDKALTSGKNLENITTSLIDTGARIGRLMEVTKLALDANSSAGKAISKMEKEQIYKSIRDVEEKISNLKLSIGIK